MLKALIPILFLGLSITTLGQYPTEISIERFCTERGVNFEEDIATPFHQYLGQLEALDRTEVNPYKQYIKYLIEHDERHKVLDSTSSEYKKLQESLNRLGFIKNQYVHYQTLNTLLKEGKFKKDPIVKDFIGIIKVLEKENYRMGPGLIASGIMVALTDHKIDITPYRKLLIITLAPYALFN